MVIQDIHPGENCRQVEPDAVPGNLNRIGRGAEHTQSPLVMITATKAVGRRVIRSQRQGQMG